MSSPTASTSAAPSRLPGWTIGHVLTHLARNADSMTWVLESSERGEVVDRYPGGVERRNADIEAGAGRPAAEQIADVAATDARLDAAFAAHTRWDGRCRDVTGRVIEVDQLVFMRWRGGRGPPSRPRARLPARGLAR